MSDRRYGADEHNADYERGREDERAAIVAYLRNLPPMRGIPNMRHGAAFSDEIERGDHLRGTGD